MECDICLEELNQVERVPKMVPCGHTVCLQCLEQCKRKECPTCRKAFDVTPDALPNNYYLLRQMELPDRLPRGWCSDCRAAAVARCWEDHDVLPEKRALRRHLQGALQQAARQLEDLPDLCQGEQVVHALTLLNAESWSLTLQSGGDELTGSVTNTEDSLTQLMWLLVASKAALSKSRVDARGPPPAVAGPPPAAPGPAPPKQRVPRGPRPQLATAGPPSASPGPSQAATQGPPPAAAGPAPPQSRGPPPSATCPPPAAAGPAPPEARGPPPSAASPPPAAAHPAPPVARSESEMILMSEVSFTEPNKRQQDKAAILANAPGMTGMIGLYCHKDPAWGLQLLQSVAPTLERLSVYFPSEAHLRAVHAMPRLRRLWVMTDAAQLAQSPELPALPPGHAGVQWLRVWFLPHATTQSLLQAHGGTLEELELGVGTAGRHEWPRSCGDLHSLLQQSGLRALRRLVLRRDGFHRATACIRQRAEVRRVLPGAEVLCGSCDRVEWEEV